MVVRIDGERSVTITGEYQSMGCLGWIQISPETGININKLLLQLSEGDHSPIPGEKPFILEKIIFILATFLECAALVIIMLACVRALQRLLKRWIQHRQLIDYREVIRLELGLSLALSLEFLLAADIVATAVSPSWDDLGKLAVVAAIRTFLNYFLEQEVAKLEDKNQKSKLLVKQIKDLTNQQRKLF